MSKFVKADKAPDTFTITQQLRAEHLSFRCMLREIEASLKEQSPDRLSQVKRALKQLLPLLSTHEQVEEQLLFPAALESVAGLRPEVVAMFRSEHEELNEKLEVLRDSLEIRMAPVSQFVAVVNFQSFLKDHMEEEEQTLFPLIEKNMSGKLQQALGENARRLGARTARRAKAAAKPPSLAGTGK